MSFTFQNPFAYFNNPSNSNPVGLGNLYVGLPDTDPVDILNPANQIPVYAVQPDGSELAIPQPVRMTTGGVLTYNGTPIQLKINNESYSVKVTSLFGSQLYYTARAYSPDYELRKDLEDGTAIIAGILSGNFRNFIIITAPAGDAGAYINGLIADGRENIFCSGGDEYIFNTPIVASNVRLNLLGAGKTITIFKRGPSLGTANIITGELHDLQIEQIGFDTGKGTYTPTLASPTLENAVNSLSPTRLSITDCDFRNLVNFGVIVNGSLLNEAKDINVSGNTAENGSRGFVSVRRYGNGVHIDRNIIHNIIDSSLGGVNFDKPIEVSGSHDVSISDNIVSSSNGEGGPIIVEYIDRESVNVHIERNTYYGDIAEVYYKVGASSNIWFRENHASGGAQVGAYFEGCDNVWIEDNRLVSTRQNSLILAQDADTGRFCKRVKIIGNHFVDANTGGNTVGVPYTSSGAPQSYHVWVQDDSEQVELENNHYIKRGTAIAGGVLISSPSYTIKGEDFSALDDDAVTINNNLSPIGARYEIVDCIGCKTTDAGDITASGSATALIEPNIVSQFSPNTQISLKTALSGTVAYIFADPDVPPNMVLTLKDSAHVNAIPPSPVTVSWSVDCSKVAKGALGKTVV